MFLLFSRPTEWSQRRSGSLTNSCERRRRKKKHSEFNWEKLYSIVAIRHKWRQFNSWLPINKRTLIKILFVLAYAQMLVQQMENKQSFMGQSATGDYRLLLDDSHGVAHPDRTSCCDGGHALSDEPHLTKADPSDSWLSCMWNSAKACSQATSRGSADASSLLDQRRPSANRATRYMEALLAFLGELVSGLVGLLALAAERLAGLHTYLYSGYALWLVRWRSPIIQRLMQSIFVQLHYICSLTLPVESEEVDDDGLVLASNFS